MFWENGYVQNVLSDFITIGILVAVGSTTYRLSRRRALLSFFECSSTRQLNVYLSNLTIRRGTALDLQGHARGHSGPAVPGYEVNLVAGLYQLFSTPIPGLEGQPGLLRFLTLRDMDVRVEPSPLGSASLRSTGSLLAVGSSGYNVATVAAEDSARAAGLAYLDLESGVTLMSGSTDFSGGRYALVQKVFSPDRGQWIFMVAGMNVAGTTAAYLHLLNNWKSLGRRYGHGPDSQFSLVLEVGGGPGHHSSVTHRSEPRRRGSRRRVPGRRDG